MGTDSRSQSEVIGVVLLTAVVVVLVALIGAVVLSERLEDGETRIDVRVGVDQTEDNTTVIVQHHGGPTVDTADVRVIVEAEDREEFRLNAAEPEQDRFGAPDILRYNDFEAQFTGIVEVIVVYVPEGTVLHESVHEDKDGEIRR